MKVFFSESSRRKLVMLYVANVARNMAMPSNCGNLRDI